MPKELDCANCGHSKSLHFKVDAYVPGKCDYQYDLCGCRNFVPKQDDSSEYKDG